MTSKRTQDGKLAIARVDDLLLSAFADSPWSDESWREYCEAGAILSTPSSRARGAITFAPGQGPTLAQRKIFVEEYGERLGLRELRYAILISDSMLVRGTFTATSWLVQHHAQMKAYKPEEIRVALAFVHRGMPFDLEGAVSALDRLMLETGWRRYRSALRGISRAQ